MLICEEVEGGK